MIRIREYARFHPGDLVMVHGNDHPCLVLESLIPDKSRHPVARGIYKVFSHAGFEVAFEDEIAGRLHDHS